MSKKCNRNSSLPVHNFPTLQVSSILIVWRNCWIFNLGRTVCEPLKWQSVKFLTFLSNFLKMDKTIKIANHLDCNICFRPSSENLLIYWKYHYLMILHDFLFSFSSCFCHICFSLINELVTSWLFRWLLLLSFCSFVWFEKSVGMVGTWHQE